MHGPLNVKLDWTLGLIFATAELTLGPKV